MRQVPVGVGSDLARARSIVKERQEEAKRPDASSAMVFDELPIRNWDHFVDTRTVSQVFYAPITQYAAQRVAHLRALRHKYGLTSASSNGTLPGHFLHAGCRVPPHTHAHNNRRMMPPQLDAQITHCTSVLLQGCGHHRAASRCG